MGLLALAPLITSTASLMFAHDQDLFFRAFLDDNYRGKANAILPPWTRVCLQRAYLVILVLYPATLILALANTNIWAGHRHHSTIYYWAGILFTMGHFAFGKQAIGLLDRIQNDASVGNATADMKAWLDMNLARSLVVDLPGWVCFLLAAVGGPGLSIRE